MKIAVCDDEKEYIELMISKLKSLDEDDQFSYMRYTPEGLILDIEENYFDSDIIIMDINFENPDYDGIDLVKRINKKYPACKIIFISNNVNYTEKTYETEHCFFIRKKNVNRLLKRALEKAVAESEADRNGKVISVYSKRIKIFLRVNDIMYLRRSGKNIVIHCNDGSEIVSKMSLSGFLKAAAGEKLVRIHGSYVINMRYIKRFSTDTVTLETDIRHRKSSISNDHVSLKEDTTSSEDGTESPSDGTYQIKLPVGKTFLESLENAYNDYSNSRM